MVASQRNASHLGLSLILAAGSFITVFFWPFLVDPFNAPKSWILLCCGLWLFGMVAFQSVARWNNTLDRTVIALSLMFLFFLLIALFETDEKLQGFFGDYGRRTGFLCYLSLISFFLAVTFQFKITHIGLLDWYALVTGSVVGLYGFFQHFKVDFIKWNNPLNSVLSTLGNPDFAASTMSIFMVVAVGLLLNKSKNTNVRLWGAINTLLLALTIFFSQVRQGLIAGLIGSTVIILSWTSLRSKALAWFLAGLSIVTGILGFLGTLNHGPLKSFLYKQSVTFRGDYWRAGIRMFKSHPWFGVGLDRYGFYFRQYRDSTQVLRRGPEIISSAAHNVPIQLAATGGVFVVVCFLALNIFIFCRGILAIVTNKGLSKIVVATYFGAWLAYEIQSLVSVDNIGISISGWILGGAVIAFSRTSDSTLSINLVNKIKSASVNRKRSLISTGHFPISLLCLFLGLVLCIPQYLSDSSLRSVQSLSPTNSSQSKIYLDLVQKPTKYWFTSAYTKFNVASLLAQHGFTAESRSFLGTLVTSDSRNYDALNGLALLSEHDKSFPEAIIYRRKMILLDPWNYQNLLLLGEDLKKVGDVAGAKQMLQRIYAFASSTPEAAIAKRDFGT
jgi:putative inorganic carbon (hco3(-)) transporter